MKAATTPRNRRDPITLNGAINATLIQPGDGKHRNKVDAELLTYARAIAQRYTSGTILEAVHQVASEEWQAIREAQKAAAKAAHAAEAQQ